ncbi:MAG: hypothetical protein GWM98_05700, partial [Nitrospinaceae bacterium]|nr:hypothetical protein [Nitrospinaceae bacterium]NIR54055.1 hypothetical protein [Nitrospinaceae bacterium]NIS84472.1 hypothetical protein [Nitrospinaceae bacterium]NIT81268.1 hypothetical protein [Nitrospinaceae bacterium]NIU43555.1 hypothetical protein [Nitrospinaceae bacterium]
TDQERAEFIDKYFNRPLHHCSYYDIEFNTEKVSNESLCKVVELLLEEKKAR